MSSNMALLLRFFPGLLIAVVLAALLFGTRTNAQAGPDIGGNSETVVTSEEPDKDAPTAFPVTTVTDEDKDGPAVSVLGKRR